MKLDSQDLRWALTRLPRDLEKVMRETAWQDRIFVGGGYIRAIVAGEKISDVDVFVKSKEDALALATLLNDGRGTKLYETENAYTVKGKIAIQIIHRWVFEKPEDVSNSFDFTVCCGVMYYDSTNGRYDSYCDERFYIDLAAKRLVYREPIRNEDAGGSMLRVLKYYQKGYRIPLNSLGAVIARLLGAVDKDKVNLTDSKAVAKVITALLVEVDPAVDPEHLAHLPSTEEEVEE